MMPGCKPGDMAIMLPLNPSDTYPNSPLHVNTGRFVQVGNRDTVEEFYNNETWYHIIPLDGKPLMAYHPQHGYAERMECSHPDKLLQPIRPQKQETREIQETRKLIAEKQHIKMKQKSEFGFD